MLEFDEKWNFKKGSEPIRLFNTETMEPIDPRDITAGPGPGFPKNQSVRRQRFGENYIE